mmetsp:Transcript_25754/g.59790  ORF Transcript_25754/g.59790 Transcript_25754/m.59790 type:complete len:204 (+) Transcript_25754:573-1184(+)
MELLLHALDASVVPAEHTCQKAACRHDEDEFHEDRYQTHIGHEDVERGEHTPACKDVASPRRHESRADHNVSSLVFVAFEEGRHLEDAPEPLYIGCVPQHQHGARLLHDRPDIQNALRLQPSIMLVYADLIQENRLPRSPKQQGRAAQGESHNQGIRSELISLSGPKQRKLPVKTGKDACAVQEHHDKCARRTRDDRGWTILK